MPSAGKRKRPKRKERDDASELWRPSPTPSEDWGSDADVEFEYDILGEEVGFGGNMRYEVIWKGWERADGTSTTWQGPEGISLDNWTARASPQTPDIELWGTTDIVNTRTRERKQGYEEPPDEQALEDFQAESTDILVRRMQELMADKMEVFPQFFPLDAAGHPRPTPATTTTAPLPPPPPRRSHGHLNAQAGPSRVRVNAEAGSSRLPPPNTPPSKTRTPLPPPSPSPSSRVRPPPRPLAPVPIPSRRIPPPPGSPAISVSSVESIEFMGTSNPKLMPLPLPPPPAKRKATSPPNAAAAPPPKRRGLPVPRDPLPSAVGASTSASASKTPALRPSTSVAGFPSKPARKAEYFPPPHRHGPTRPPTRASASTSTPPPPRRPLKRRLPSSSDEGDDEGEGEDDVRVRKCACGTLLPPPDVHRRDVCDTCRPGKAAKRDDGRAGATSGFETRGGSVGWDSRASTARASSVASTSVTAVNGGRLPPRPTNSVRKGKAPESAKSLRLQIESKWTDAIAQSSDGEGSSDGAAGITFVNDVDEEEIPPSLHGGRFEYLEDRYRVEDELGLVQFPDNATPLADPGAFMFCDCKTCDVFEGCCQDTGPETISGYAYTDGLFNFTYARHNVVVECNPYCDCPPTCPNRVAQRPRRVPIQVFKTAGGRRGWGARALVDVRRGEVVGVYTGKLIARAEAESLTGARKQYCFDLDYNENEDDDEDVEHKYSVDSFAWGNWTRFINHSCAPNLRAQPVVYDTLPSQGIAFLAFIATERIPALTEFTFDYDPGAQQRPHGASKCWSGII
ncbi:hypothetical protein DFH08DRAFT_944399 [Mycena albidolilacea]|uniref:SET domain-containing protein n=1 Tax=Mycena albidolilacea TaxID=1033008 RepID=A0AAD6Z6A1_9AGAR|nr:hypothetical protein DFH08DRAFT_944399 [Mycena albidolilacea]